MLLRRHRAQLHGAVRVMENLKAQGFSIKPDRQTLTCGEMMLTAGALAQLHGLSHRLEFRSGKSLAKKFDWLVDQKNFLETAIYEYHNGVKTFAATFPDQTDLAACLEKVKLQPVLLDVLKSPRVKVLNQTDSRTSNVMIKYEGDVPMAVKLVDWQGLQYLPPTYDLALMFLCSAGWDVFHNHRDAILAHYHQQLHNTLGPTEPSGLQSYTLEQLKADFRADSLYGVISRFIRLAILPADPGLLRMVQEIKKWGVL
ncbi:uncharacterized protein [Branchiostoma lanceolatum]|uniref:uncharacterized protein n=1 Tax=Branchiostoma lanceolatum TaxID=7740 RepID=UPI003451DF51